jgi:hypothetical protein
MDISIVQARGNVRRIHNTAVLLSLILCGCKSAKDGSVARHIVRDSAGITIVENSAPRWREQDRWSVASEPLFVLRAFDNTAENRLLDPTSVDVDSRGRIVVGDGNQVGWDAVLVYDPAGKFLFQAGRSGKGPGEFGQLWWASAYRGDSIAAFDMSGDQISIFTPDGKFGRSFRTPNLQTPRPSRGTYGYTAGADAAYGDGDFLAYPFGYLDINGGAGPAWYKHLLLKLSPSGESWDTLGTFEISQQYWSGTKQEEYWFAPVAISTVGPDALYFGRGDSFEIKVHDGTGRLVRIVRRKHESRPVTDDHRTKLREWYLDRLRSSPEVNDQSLQQMQRSFESARFAQVLPPYSAAQLDPTGHLWVEEFRWMVADERSPLTGPTQWSVFDPDGVWLGNVEMPEGFILRKVTKNRVLGFRINDEDEKEIYAYALHRSQ